jgi:NAD(P)-dependent dehydrogenase (short-subunit alcohol dehydrogenase family)
MTALMANILVTGSSTGIGLATALHFARRGHPVYATLRTPGASNELTAAVAGGLPIRELQLDVTSDESVSSCLDEILHSGAHIDVLVNNAGIGGGGPVELSSVERAKHVFDTNYFGAVRMIRSVLPAMREAGHGAIVNITSMAGRVCLPAHSHYCASKFALEALTEGLAAEVLPFGIRVASVEPGVILTPIFTKSSSAKTRDVRPYEMPVRRLRQLFASRLAKPVLPEAVAAAVEEAAFGLPARLRYVVGPDAESLMAARTRVSDEEWIRIHTIADDEEFFDVMQQLCGKELYRTVDTGVDATVDGASGHS